MQTIAVDAMGGDHAPKAEVEGAIRALRGLDVKVVLVGQEGVIRQELAQYEDYRDLPIEIAHAPDVVTMEDSAARAVRKKPNRQLPGQWPNADAGAGSPVIHRVDTDKPRRGPGRRHGSNNLVDLGEGSAGRAIRQVLTLTAQVRATLDQRGTPSTSLLLGRRAKALEGGSVFADGATAELAIKAWSDGAGLAGGDGPLRVRARRLRRTVQVLYGGARHKNLRPHQNNYLMCGGPGPGWRRRAAAGARSPAASHRAGALRRASQQHRPHPRRHLPDARRAGPRGIRRRGCRRAGRGGRGRRKDRTSVV